MNPQKFLPLVCALTLVSTFSPVMAQDSSTAPATVAEREALYTEALERRADDILQRLSLADAAKAGRVRQTLLLQYRTLRLRDEVISAKLKADGKEPDDYAARLEWRKSLSQPLHAWFVGVLAVELSPAQVEAVKDAMTYNKVKVTYDAYCQIIPGLKDGDKAKILELLKVAREEAIDGGSAPEKSAIFQRHKDVINDYLNANGYDVAKAYKDWEAKQPKSTAGS
jgi:hypothetical protein